jgi:hypothetical protein
MQKQKQNLPKKSPEQTIKLSAALRKNLARRKGVDSKNPAKNLDKNQ